jgi:hypothetical protein
MYVHTLRGSCNLQNLPGAQGLYTLLLGILFIPALTVRPYPEKLVSPADLPGSTEPQCSDPQNPYAGPTVASGCLPPSPAPQAGPVPPPIATETPAASPHRSCSALV